MNVMGFIFITQNFALYCIKRGTSHDGPRNNKIYLKNENSFTNK